MYSAYYLLLDIVIYENFEHFLFQNQSFIFQLVSQLLATEGLSTQSQM